MKTVVYLLVLSVLSGCASKGFNRGSLKGQLGVAQFEYSDQKIEEVFKKKANLPKPFSLAVYMNKKPGRGIYKGADWRWSKKDYEILENAGKELKKEGLVSKIVPILGTLVKENNLKSIRLAAAKHGADAVLIISGIADVDRYLNNWGWSYALLLPALFVPGSEVQGLFLANASLWDVRNEFLYLTTESESLTQEKYIAAFGKRDQEIINIAKEDAVKKLGANLLKMVKGL